VDPVLGPTRVVFCKMCLVTSSAGIGASGGVVLDRHDTSSGKGSHMRLMPLEAARRLNVLRRVRVSEFGDV